MDAVLALVRHGPARCALQAAAVGIADVHFCEHVADVAADVAAYQPVLILAELVDAAGQDLVPALTRLRERMPRPPLYLYTSLAVPEVRRAVDLASSRVAQGLVFRGLDPLRPTLRDIMQRAAPSSETHLVRQILAPLLPPELTPFLEVCARASTRPCSANEIARQTGVPLRALETQLRHRGLPTARRVFGWCRLLRAGVRLAQPGTTLKGIASALGYPSVTALRQHLRRQSGLTLDQLQQPGGAQELAARAVADF